MSCKRSYADQDPDYENDLSNDQKRLKVIEKDNKEATVRKIEQIITTQFNHEMKLKENEIKEIDDRLYQTIKMLDQLRMCVITSYYSFENQSGTALLKPSGSHPPPIHPTVKKYLGKQPKMNFSFSVPDEASVMVSSTDTTVHKLTADKVSLNNDVNVHKDLPSTVSSSSPTVTCVNVPIDDGSRAFRFKTKKRVVVGNVSKYIPVDKREDKDQSTHKWMVYVRGPKEEPYIEMFVKKVWFFLHPSYRPNDLVEVNSPPFHLTRRGWGEFPVRVQLHFHDSRNKRVDIIHTLKLDKTYTGLQTLGSETFVDILIYKPGLDSETVDRSNANAMQPSLAVDIGGVTIPATIKEELQSPTLTEPSIITTFTTAQDSGIKQEVQDQDENYHGEKYVSSFINDHGYYSSSVNINLVKSEHSYQAEEPLSVDKPNLVSADECVQQSHPALTVKIKAEPPDETSKWHLPLSSVACASFEQNGFQRLETAENHASKSGMSSLSFDGTVAAKIEASDNVDSEEVPLTLNSLSPSSAALNCVVNRSLQFDETAAEVGIIQSINSELQCQSQASTSLVNSLSVNITSPKSESRVHDFSHLTSISASESSKSASKISLPSSDVNLNPPTLVEVQAETKKSEIQSQANNGVATFVKCVDKRGNLFLIPLAMFLKINPSTQTSITQSVLHNSSSLLKSSLVCQNMATTTTTTSMANSSTSPALLPGTSLTNNTPSGVQRASTPMLVSSILAALPSKKSNPAIVTFPNTSASQNNSLQSSLLPSNYTSPQSNHVNHHLHHSLLLPQNSVSLLSGISKLKSVLGSNSSSSSSKPMVSCLLKNKVVNNKTSQASEVPKISLNVDCYESMSQIMRYVAKNYPLVATKPDRSLHPYCAPSIKDFLNWNVGKQHAAEWQRAKAVQKQVLQLIQNSSRWKTEDVWSVKQLLLWCRYSGYSPMKTDLDSSKLSESDEAGNLEEAFFTYSESKEFLEALCEAQQKHQQLENSEEPEEDIDVVTVDEGPQMKAAKSPEKAPTGSYLRLSSSLCGEFVRETVEQIGLKLIPEELPSNIVAPLGEEVLLTAVKQFAEEILSSALARVFKKTGNKSCPGEISVLDVGNAICELPHCDFLTNRFLGAKLSKQLINIAHVKL